MDALHPVYIVDDDHEVRTSIAFMLGAEGRSCRCFASGGELIKALPELAPGCILLDVRMPGMSGLDVLEALPRGRVAWPVVVMTGHGECEIAAQAIRLGALDFVEKPFDDGLLVTCLDRACRTIET